MSDSAVVRDLALLLGAAALGGALAQWWRQPAFVGYILGGLLLTAVAGPALGAAGTFDLFAQFGVMLLMFSLGLEFSMLALWRARALALVGAPLGMAAITAIVMVAGVASAGGAAAVITGLALAVCSTAALAKLLAERGDLRGPVGRSSIAVSIGQDLAVVAAMFLIPSLAGRGDATIRDLALALARGVLVLGPFFFLAHRIVPTLLARVAHAQNTELFVLVAVMISIGFAALSVGLGLTMALGAFLAGLVISESAYTTETLARVLPLRDLFVAAFFVSVGTLIDVRAVIASPGLVLSMVAVVLIAKPLAWTLVAMAFRHPLPIALAIGVGQSQIGEFSFVIAQLGYALGVLPAQAYSAILATSLITLLANALVFRRSRPLERWADRWARPPEAVAEAARPVAVVAGFGRVGGAIGEALESFGIPFAVVDFNPAVVQGLRQRSIPAVLGDAANELALSRAGAAGARLAVVAVPDGVKAELALRRLRALNPAVVVVARAHSAEDRDRLFAAGATDVILPETEAGLTVIDHTLHHLAVPAADVRAYLRRMREVERPGGRVPESESDRRLPRTAVIDLGEGPLASQSLRASRIRERTGVVVIGIERRGAEPHWNPPPDAVLLAGDRVTVVGLPDQIERFRRVNAGDDA